MNANAKLWVEALRSGKYKKGYGFLRQGEYFCCLGVACEIFQETFHTLSVLNTREIYEYDEKVFYLPLSVQKWLGLSTKLGEYYDTTQAKTSLACLNDSEYSFSFEHVANIIESEPPGLFIK